MNRRPHNLKSKYNGLPLNRKFTLLILCMVIVPIAILGSVIFFNMKNNVVSENLVYMRSTLERSRDSVDKNIEQVKMATQYFESNSSVSTVLEKAATGKTMSARELYEFYNTDIVSLERLLNNYMPSLYSVHVFSTGNNIQEMMPILYNADRMAGQSWAKDDPPEGWKFGFTDHTIVNTDNASLIALVTDLKDYQAQTIGRVEVSMTMEEMFPYLYENTDQTESCFITSGGQRYTGNVLTDEAGDLIRTISLTSTEDSVQTLHTEIGGNQFVVAIAYVSEMNGYMISVNNITSNLSPIRNLFIVFLVCMIFFTTALWFGINMLVKHMLRHLYGVIESVHQVQRGDLSVRVKDYGDSEMGDLSQQINKMLDRIQLLMKENIRREVLIKDSELRALQNQINAHFLYNVLESIKMMAEIDGKYEISDAVTSLGELLRYSMRWTSGNVRIREELNYIQNYLKLMNLRFDYQINLSVEIPGELMNQKIPKMSLQPLVENSVYHGIEQNAQDAVIYLKSITNGDECEISVMDTGTGMTEEELTALRKKITEKTAEDENRGHGIGLRNVHERIQLAFGKKYGLTVDSRYGHYMRVSLHLPLMTSDTKVEDKSRNENTADSRR